MVHTWIQWGGDQYYYTAHVLVSEWVSECLLLSVFPVEAPVNCRHSTEKDALHTHTHTHTRSHTHTHTHTRAHTHTHTRTHTHTQTHTHAHTHTHTHTHTHKHWAMLYTMCTLYVCVHVPVLKWVLQIPAWEKKIKTYLWSGSASITRMHMHSHYYVAVSYHLPLVGAAQPLEKVCVCVCVCACACVCVCVCVCVRVCVVGLTSVLVWKSSFRRWYTPPPITGPTSSLHTPQHTTINTPTTLHTTQHMHTIPYVRRTAFSCKALIIDLSKQLYTQHNTCTLYHT